MKKILVLGSDYSSEQVVIEAHAHGMYVIVADLMNLSPAKMQADERWLISTTDIDTLEKKCKECGVEAVMFGASDFNINNARILCKRLGLPIYCDEDDAWKVARDKSVFKEVCKAVGAPVAEDFHLTDALLAEDVERIKYPVVVKPSDKSGNRGLSFCNNQEELVVAYKNARSISDNRRIIVERKLTGDEYNVHYVLANGDAKLLYFNGTYHEPGQSSNLYSFKCTSSYHLKQYIEEVDEVAKAVLKQSKCKNGIAWFDVIRDNDGKFYLLEMGHRFGGVMTYRPYESVTGFNTIKWMLECACGIQHSLDGVVDLSKNRVDGCAGSYHLFTTEDSVIEKICGIEELEAMPNVWIDMPKREKSQVRKFACSGLIGIYGKDMGDLCQTLSMINSVLRFEDANGKDLIIHYDDYESLELMYQKGIAEIL